MEALFKQPRELVDFSKPIIVSMESFTTLKNARSVSDDGLVWDIDFMYFDSESRNSNLYPDSDTKRSFNESAYIQENLRNRTLFGECEHPPADSTLPRFLFVEPSRYAWNILSINDAGDHYRGQVALADPMGTEIVHKNVVRFGSNYASSCRIYTPNFVEKQQNGRKVFIKKYKMYPVTFDCVTMPGLPACRLVKDGVYVAGKVDNSSMIKSGESYVHKFDNPAEAFKEMMKSEESGRILQDYFGADFDKKAVIMKDDRVKLSTESGVDIIVPLNRHLISSILGK